MSRLLAVVRDALLEPPETAPVAAEPSLLPASVAVVGPREVAIPVAVGLVTALAGRTGTAIVAWDGPPPRAVQPVVGRAARCLAEELPGARALGRVVWRPGDAVPDDTPFVLAAAGPRTASADAAIAACGHVVLAVPPGLPDVVADAAVADLRALGRPVALVVWGPGPLRRAWLRTGRAGLPRRIGRAARTPVPPEPLVAPEPPVPPDST